MPEKRKQEREQKVWCKSPWKNLENAERNCINRNAEKCVRGKKKKQKKKKNLVKQSLRRGGKGRKKERKVTNKFVCRMHVGIESEAGTKGEGGGGGGPHDRRLERGRF